MSRRHEVAADLSPGLLALGLPCKPTRSVRAADQGVAGEVERPDSVALSGQAPI